MEASVEGKSALWATDELSLESVLSFLTFLFWKISNIHKNEQEWWGNPWLPH